MDEHASLALVKMIHHDSQLPICIRNFLNVDGALKYVQVRADQLRMVKGPAQGNKFAPMRRNIPNANDRIFGASQVSLAPEFECAPDIGAGKRFQGNLIIPITIIPVKYSEDVPLLEVAFKRKIKKRRNTSAMEHIQRPTIITYFRGNPARAV